MFETSDSISVDTDYPTRFDFEKCSEKRFQITT